MIRTPFAYAFALAIASSGASGQDQQLEIEEGGIDLTSPGAYGTEGQQYITFGGGVAHDFSEAWDTNLHVAWSTFILDDVEMAIEGGLWSFNQEGDDAFGLSAGLAFRWHFVNRDSWTIFADGGVSLLGATDNVPDLGTGFNFMPRIGAGFTWALTEEARLMGGVRWHHISNARIHGDIRNPSRDGVMLYAGVSLPF